MPFILYFCRADFLCGVLRGRGGGEAAGDDLVGRLHVKAVGGVGQEAGQFLLDVGLGEVAADQLFYHFLFGNKVYKGEVGYGEDEGLEPHQVLATSDVIHCHLRASQQGGFQRCSARVDDRRCGLRHQPISVSSEAYICVAEVRCIETVVYPGRTRHHYPIRLAPLCR